jgi:hypothetical protein
MAILNEWELLFGGILEPCGCSVYVWREGNSLYVSPCCDSCRKMVIAAIRAVYPDLPERT